MSRHVLVPIVDGCEEIEAVCTINSLRRAGAQVSVASCQPDKGLRIKGSREVILTGDCHINYCTEQAFHMIAVPGGMPGAEYFRDCHALVELLAQQKKLGKWYAALCASPAIVLAYHGLLDNVQATCHPSFIEHLDSAQAQLGSSVVVDMRHKVITAQGPGSALGFSFKLIDALYGKDAHRPIAKQMMADWAL